MHISEFNLLDELSALELQMTLPRRALIALFQIGIDRLCEELANLDYADKDHLQLSYTKLNARKHELLELQELISTIPTTLPGESQ